MPYFVDASNLGGVVGGRAGARDAAAVVARLLPWARDRGRVVLVFDGPAQPETADRYGELEVVWSGAGCSADDAIVRRVRAAPQGAVVVTNDRELARRARDAGAKVEPVAALLERVDRPHPGARRRTPRSEAETQARKPRPSPDDVAHWLGTFDATSAATAPTPPARPRGRRGRAAR